MNNQLLKVLVFFLICTGSAFSQSVWVSQSGGTNNNLFSVCFINNQTGWISGDNGVILRTTNSGVNWIIQTSGTTFPLLNIMFADENTGWAAGGYDDNNPLCNSYRVVSKTTNGGINWVSQEDGGQGYLYNDLAVVNDQTVFVSNAGVC